MTFPLMTLPGEILQLLGLQRMGIQRFSNRSSPSHMGGQTLMLLKNRFSLSTSWFLNCNMGNHRMVWVGRDLKDHLVPTPLP